MHDIPLSTRICFLSRKLKLTESFCFTVFWYVLEEPDGRNASLLMQGPKSIRITIGL